MIRQDCDRLKALSNKPFEAWACKWFLCFYFSEQTTNAYYDALSVVNITEEALHQAYLAEDLGLYGHKNTEHALQALRVPVIKDGVREEGPDYICKKNELEMLDCRRTVKRKEYQHFTAGDGKGNYSWDSLGIRPWQRDYKVHSKRIITLKDGWYNG